MCYTNFQPHRKQCRSSNQIKSNICVNRIIVLSLTLIHVTSCQNIMNQFPPLFNTAKNRPVTTDPSGGTCGVPVRNAYCKSSVFPDSSCILDYCVQTCPNRTSLPIYQNLLSPSLTSSRGIGKCIVYDSINVPPDGVKSEESTFFVSPGEDCFLTPLTTPKLATNSSFTLSVWVWLSLQFTDPG